MPERKPLNIVIVGQKELGLRWSDSYHSHLKEDDTVVWHSPERFLEERPSCTLLHIESAPMEFVQAFEKDPFPLSDVRVSPHAAAGELQWRHLARVLTNNPTTRTALLSPVWYGPEYSRLMRLLGSGQLGAVSHVIGSIPASLHPPFINPEDPLGGLPRALLTILGMAGRAPTWDPEWKRGNGVLSVNGTLPDTSVAMSLALDPNEPKFSLDLRGSLGTLRIVVEEPITRLLHLPNEGPHRILVESGEDLLVRTAGAVVRGLREPGKRSAGLSLAEAAKALRPLFRIPSPEKKVISDSPASDGQRVERMVTVTPEGCIAQEAKIHIESRCNFRCPFCFERTPVPVATSSSEFAVLFSRLVAEGITRVIFSGGEPTLHPRLETLIRSGYDAGMTQVSLETNALLFRDAHRAESLKEAGLSNTFVSFHSHRQVEFEKLTGVPGSYSDVIKGVKNLLRAGVPVHLNHVISTVNLPHLEEGARWLCDTFPGVKEVTLSVVAVLGAAVENLSLVPPLRELAGPLGAAIDIFTAGGVTATIPGPCGVPQCVLPAHQDAFVNERFHLASPETSLSATTDRVYGPQCRECLKRSWCHGLWSGYGRLFGFEELVPFREPTEHNSISNRQEHP